MEIIKDQVVTDRAAKLASDLRRRSVNLRRYAAWILVIIVAVLLSGIAVFVSAGALANRETTTAVDESRRALLDVLRTRRVAAENEIKQLNMRQTDAENNLQKEVAGRGMSGRMGIGPVAMTLQRQVAELEYRKRNLEAEIADIDRRTPQLAIPATKSIPSEAQFASLISAISTRVGAIVLLLFLVQILVPLYRYNMKLASHYESCADAIDLLLIGGMSVPLDLFVRLASSLSPSGVEFGAAPTAPTEQALRLVADILTRK